MQIFVLKPVNLLDSIWENRERIAKIIVRALTEGKARELAELKFDSKKASTLRDGGEILPSPWRDRSKTLCNLYEGHSYHPDGPEEVLFPRG